MYVCIFPSLIGRPTCDIILPPPLNIKPPKNKTASGASWGSCSSSGPSSGPTQISRSWRLFSRYAPGCMFVYIQDKAIARPSMHELMYPHPSLHKTHPFLTQSPQINNKQIMGTPTEERWPGWSKLPNVGIMKFQKTPHNNLRAHLYQTCVRAYSCACTFFFCLFVVMRGSHSASSIQSLDDNPPHENITEQTKQPPVHLLLRLLRPA